MSAVAWLLFIPASLVLIASPGQDMLLVLSRSTHQGAAAGVATAAGVSVSLVGHTMLATLGLTFLIKGPVGLAAGYLSGWLRANAAGLCWRQRTSGAVLIGLVVKLAMEQRN